MYHMQPETDSWQPLMCACRAGPVYSKDVYDVIVDIIKNRTDQVDVNLPFTGFPGHEWINHRRHR